MFDRFIGPIACVVFVVAGCGPYVAPETDPDQGLAVLKAALDSWKRGEATETLQKRRPPIWFNEPERARESKLADYQIDEKATKYGRQMRCAVKLTLETKGGKKLEKQVGYLIDTTPNCVIAPEGF